MQHKTSPLDTLNPAWQVFRQDLGRRIIRTIMTSPPADHTKMKREAARAEQRLNEIAKEYERNAAVQKSNICQ